MENFIFCELSITGHSCVCGEIRTLLKLNLVKFLIINLHKTQRNGVLKIR